MDVIGRSYMLVTYKSLRVKHFEVIRALRNLLSISEEFKS